jgi:hypothetical protein
VWFEARRVDISEYEGRGLDELPEDCDLHRVVVDHHLRDVDIRAILLLRSSAQPQRELRHGRGE